jgi:hypothetical protein
MSICAGNINYPKTASVNSEGAEEFEGVMCLVMDRKEAKNALSVQMVAVSP